MSDTIKNLNSLFRLNTLPVAAVRGDELCYCNPAAEKFFSGQFTGKKATEIFPRWPYNAGSVVSVRLLNTDCVVTVTELDDLLVLNISKAVDARQAASIPAGALSGMASTITTLRLAADKLADLSAPGEKQELYLSMLYHNYFKLLRTTEHLASISKLVTNDFPFEPRNIEMGSFLSDLISSVRDLTADSGVTLEYEPPDGLITVNADPNLIEQLILILISNSLKHTAPGGKIRLSVSESAGHATLSVDDNGSGIAPELLSGIFNIEAPENPTDMPTGTDGLGLPLASVIASRHNGTIIAESREGKGTSIRVLLRACIGTPALRAPAPRYGNPVPTRALTELSDVLPRSQYTQEKLKR